MKVRIKRSGILFIGVTIFLGVAAANTGNNLLYIVVSAMLSLMLVSGISSLLNIKDISIGLVPPPEVYANRPAPFRLVVSRKRRIQAFGRIGEVTLELSSDFPLGMFIRSTEVAVPLNLVVFPEPIPTDRLFAQIQGEAGGSSPEVAALKGYDELKEIREYSGEPMKLIHWKISAKLGVLMIKEMVAEEKEPVILSLELVEGDVETRLSKLTYLTLELMKLGYPVGLKLKDRQIPPARGESHKPGSLLTVENYNVLSPWTLYVFLNLKLHPLPLLKGFEPLLLDGGEVDKNVPLIVITGYKPVSLVLAEPRVFIYTQILQSI